MVSSCSIVLSTNGAREAWLRRCVESLKGQTATGIDIVCVSTVRIGWLEADPAVHFILEPQRGLSRARNVGWREATGPIVAFIDDDCTADPRWIEVFLRRFRDSSIAGTTGQVLPLRPGTWHAAMPAPEEKAYHSIDDIRWPFEPGSGNNMAFRREVLESLGGFDEDLGLGSRFLSGEDLDLFIRLLKAQMTLQAEPKAIVYHEPLRTTDQVRASVLGYRYGLGALFAKFQLDMNASAVQFVVTRDAQEFARGFLRGDAFAVRLWSAAGVSVLRGFVDWKTARVHRRLGS